MEHPKLLIVDWVNFILAPVLGPLLAPLGVHTSPEHPYLIPPHIAITLLIVVGLTVFALFLRSRLSVENPGKLQILAEDGLTMFGNMMDEWIPGKGRQYMPLLLSIFLYVLIANYAGMVPGLMSPTAVLSTTLGLAITVWVYYHFQGIRAQGLKSYVLHFAAPPGAPLWMAPIMLPIELISHVSRVMSLSLRLFGNIFGHELVVFVLFFLFPFLLPLPMLILGVVTGGLQAFIFVLLTTIYLAGAVAVEHHDEHEAHDAPHDDRVDVGQGHAAATV